MSFSQLAALLETLQNAEQFAAGFEDDQAQQPPVTTLLANLRAQIAFVESRPPPDALLAGQKGDWDAPTARPTTLAEVLFHLDRSAWAMRRTIQRLPGNHPLHFHAEGRLNEALGTLRACGALPRLPRPSAEGFERALQSARAQLPDGFEHMPVAKAREWLIAHGVEATLHETPYLQRHLVAGISKHEDVAVGVARMAGKFDSEQLAVGADSDDSANPHVSAPEVVAANDAADATVGMASSTEDLAKSAARVAIHHLLQRIQRDPRLAWHFDPITRSMEELTAAHALLFGLDLPAFRKEFFASLEFESPSCGCEVSA